MAAFVRFDPWAGAEGDDNKTLAGLATLALAHGQNKKQHEPDAQIQKQPKANAKAAKVAKVQSPFTDALARLEAHCPAYIEPERWRQCVEDGREFLREWDEQAKALNWGAADLFGLHEPPIRPHPSYCRLSRYDCTGLIWNLLGRRVVALTEETAAIQSPTGHVLIYRKANKPAYGPLGDSLDDFK